MGRRSSQQKERETKDQQALKKQSLSSQSICEWYYNSIILYR
jgi:hypothetical protein